MNPFQLPLDSYSKRTLPSPDELLHAKVAEFGEDCPPNIRFDDLALEHEGEQLLAQLVEATRHVLGKGARW